MRIFRERRPSAKLLAVGVALVIASSLVGYLAGTLVRSPAQAVADTAPPAPTTLTEPVQVKKVTRSVTFDGEVQSRDSTPVAAPSGNAEGAASVLTRLPVAAGGRVRNGEVIAEVSGRPIIVLEGALPSYRTLTPGSSGPDVRQLQQALIKAGLLAVADGVYGTSTASAVQRLYRKHGYDPAIVGAEAVKAAEDQVRDAERSLEHEGRGADAVTRGFLQEDRNRALAALRTARAEAGAAVTVGEVIFVRGLPATVATLDTAVGKTAEGVLMTLTSGPLVVRGTPVAADGNQIVEGNVVRMLLTPTGEVGGRVTGSTVASAVEEGGEGGGQAPGRTYTIRPGRALPRSSTGAPVRVVVAVAISPQPGLTVPISAVSVSAEGEDTVTVVRGGRRITVKVVPGFAGDGLVQVEPVGQGALVEGDLVVVGSAR